MAVTSALVKETVPSFVGMTPSEKQIQAILRYTAVLDDEAATVVEKTLIALQEIIHSEVAKESKLSAIALLFDSPGPAGEIFRQWLRDVEKLCRGVWPHVRDGAIGAAVIAVPVLLYIGLQLLTRSDGRQWAIADGKTGMGLDPDIASKAMEIQKMRNSFIG